MTDPNRWRILGTLAEPRTAAQIATELGMKAPNVIYHMQRLLECGLVTQLPIPEYKKRFQYQRRACSAKVKMDAKGMAAVLAR